MSNVLPTSPNPVQLRAMLEAMVVGDLLSPAGGPDEELTERNVRDRYLVGVLAPRPQSQTAPPKLDAADPEGGQGAGGHPGGGAGVKGDSNVPRGRGTCGELGLYPARPGSRVDPDRRGDLPVGTSPAGSSPGLTGSRGSGNASASDGGGRAGVLD